MTKKYKRMYNVVKEEVVPHDELTSGNWDVVRVETTIRLNGYQEFPHGEVIWDRQENVVYIREEKVVMYYAPMERCTFIRFVTEPVEKEVREYPK